MRMAAEACQAALDAGIDAYAVVTDGLAVAMDRVPALRRARILCPGTAALF